MSATSTASIMLPWRPSDTPYGPAPRTAAPFCRVSNTAGTAKLASAPRAARRRPRLSRSATSFSAQLFTHKHTHTHTCSLSKAFGKPRSPGRDVLWTVTPHRRPPELTLYRKLLAPARVAVETPVLPDCLPRPLCLRPTLRVWEGEDVVGAMAVQGLRPTRALRPLAGPFHRASPLGMSHPGTGSFARALYGKRG